MQTITNSYKGLSLMVQLGADRILVPLAIVTSLMIAAAIAYQLMDGQFPASPGFY